MTAWVPSVLPPSMTMYSTSGQVWPVTEDKVCPMTSRALKETVMTVRRVMGGTGFYG